MFYIYSKKGRLRNNASFIKNKLWGAFPYAKSFTTIEEAEAEMRRHSFVTEIKQAAIMRVEQV